MDEDHENRTDNSTYLEDLDELDYEFHYYLFNCFFNTILVIALISNFLIMHLLIRTKRLKRRTYVIFLHWLAWETINLLGVHTIREVVLNLTYLLDQDHEIYCIVSGLEPWSQLICYLLMLTLSSDTVMKTKRVSTTFILITLYSILAGWVVVKSLFCFMRWDAPVIALGVLLTLIILALIVIIKDLGRCYRKIRSGVKTVDNFRTNVVRIYVYNWTLIASLLIFSLTTGLFFFHHKLHYVGVFLSTFYILIYMVLSDKVYRLHLVKLFKCDFKYEEFTATVSFDGSDSSNEAININIPDVAA